MVVFGGEGGIRTLEHLLGCYSLSRRAPSTTRPPLHSKPKTRLKRVRKGTGGSPGDQIRGGLEMPRRAAGGARAHLAARCLIGRRRFITGRRIKTSIVRSGRRRGEFDCRNHQRTLSVRRVESRRYLQRRHLCGALIFLWPMTIWSHLTEHMTAAHEHCRGNHQDSSIKTHAA